MWQCTTNFTWLVVYLGLGTVSSRSFHAMMLIVKAGLSSPYVVSYAAIGLGCWGNTPGHTEFSSLPPLTQNPSLLL